MQKQGFSHTYNKLYPVNLNTVSWVTTGSIISQRTAYLLPHYEHWKKLSLNVLMYSECESLTFENTIFRSRWSSRIPPQCPY